MTGRLVGILGGMGPEATIDFYREITRLTPARRDQEHLRLLVYSNASIPDRTAAILGEGENPLPALVESARLLERAGAELIAMPCNAAHCFYDSIQEAVRIPVLNMLYETCDEFLRVVPGGKSAGLLAATGTVRSGIYERAFRRHGVAVVTPEGDQQDRIHTAIMDVKAGRHGCATRDLFHSAGDILVGRGAQAVVLGCTEIPLAFDSATAGYPSINATEVLARAVLRAAQAGSR